MTTPVFSRAESTLLLERDAELGVIAATLRALASGAGRLLVVEGDPGAGKSSLLRVAGVQAEALDLRVLAAQGEEHQRSLAFGGALQLFEQPLRRMGEAARARVLSGAARLASDLFDPDGPAQAVFDRGRAPAIAHGLCWLVANLVESSDPPRPAVLIVDDAHLLDRPSLQFLSSLARRLGELPVAVVLAFRTRAPGDLGALAALHELGEILAPAQLSTAAVAELIRRGLGAAYVDRRFAEASGDVTGGNPFLVHALVEELRRAGTTPDAEGARRISSLIPGSVLRAVVARLAALGPDAIRLAQSVAILGDAASLCAVSRLVEVDLDETVALVDELAAAGILDPGSLLRFRHPLIRSALEAELSPAWKAASELRAAAILGELGEPAEKIATHLLLAAATGSGWVIEVLERAASEMLRRGAPEIAVEYLARALAEPPPAADRPRLLATLANSDAAAGSPAATAHLEEALSLTAAGGARANLLHAHGRVLAAAGRHRQALEAFERALGELGDSAQPHARELKADITCALASSHGSVAAVRSIVDDLRRQGGPASLAAEEAVLALEASQQALAGEPVEQWHAPAVRAIESGTLVAKVSEDGGLALTPAAVALLYADDLDRSRTLLDAAAAQAVDDGSPTATATVHYLRAWPEYFVGELTAAAADVRSAISAFRQGWGLHALAACALLAHIELDRGDLEAARAALVEAAALSATMPSWAETLLLVASARLQLAEHEPRPALDQLRAGACQLAQQGVSDRPIPWRCVATAAALALGNRPMAIELSGEELARAERIGVPRSVGMALRSHGLAWGERGLASLERAVDVLADSPSRLELARALVDLGSLYRRIGRRSASFDRLARGLEMAEEFGAGAIARRAREELRAAGARPRRAARCGLESLTAAELRVARLAASGLMNRQIAAELGVSSKAVEFHMRHVFEKLAIASRKQLASRLGAADPS